MHGSAQRYMHVLDQTCLGIQKCKISIETGFFHQKIPAGYLTCTVFGCFFTVGFSTISKLSQLKFLRLGLSKMILIKSCSIESRNDPSPKSEVVYETKFSLKISYSTHACLAQLDQHQTSKPVMVSCEFK